MHYSASRVKQDYGATGVLYDLGSVYEGLCKITDKRKARGKIYRLETILSSGAGRWSMSGRGGENGGEIQSTGKTWESVRTGWKSSARDAQEG